MELTAHPTVDVPHSSAQRNPLGPEIEDIARRRLATECPYSFYFRQISIDFVEGRLVLRGRVPSFYLKQILQTLLTELDGVGRIDNRVDVVSTTGLSSVRSSEVQD